MQDTLYIAQPLYSSKLIGRSPELKFPTIMKIGITTGAPQKREKELMGTVSPVKIAIRKAWGGIDAREAESMLHNLLDNSRLDGEYFWDGNETLIDSVCAFVERYYPKATLLSTEDDTEVKAADIAQDQHRVNRVQNELIPALNKLKINFKLHVRKIGVIIHFKSYKVVINARKKNTYSMFISSKIKTTKQALNDFPGAVISNPKRKELDSGDRKVILGTRPLDDIVKCLSLHLAEKTS